MTVHLFDAQAKSLGVLELGDGPWPEVLIERPVQGAYRALGGSARVFVLRTNRGSGRPEYQLSTSVTIEPVSTV